MRVEEKNKPERAIVSKTVLACVCVCVCVCVIFPGVVSKDLKEVRER